MTVPAKNANPNTFMFGLVHDYAHPPSTRTTAKFTIAATAPKTRSKSSHAQSMNGAAKLIPMGQPQPQPQPKQEPLGNGAAPRTRRPRTRPPSMSKTNGGVPENRAVVDWEIPRKTLHASIGFLTIYLYTSQGEPRTVIYTLSTALAIIVPADVIRLRRPRFEAFYERCLGFLMRESEKKSSNGVIWYLLGTTCVLALFPIDIATVSILILSWADTAASTFGRLLGPYTPPLPPRVPLLHLPLARRKSLAGFIASSLTGAFIAFGFWAWIAPLRAAPEPCWSWEAGLAPGFRAGIGAGVPTGGWFGLGVIAVVAGLVAGIAEALDLGSLDDNFTLPIISGTCLYGFFRLLGLFSS